MVKAIGVGDPAPDITVIDQTGRSVTLAEFRGRRPVVLFFYPKDGTPVCTREACGFRDAYEDILAAGAEVLGVSSDSAERHQTFVAEQRLPYPLLSDADGALRRAFGVPRIWGLFPGRVTYVIDKAGIVRHLSTAPLNAARHVAEALQALKALD